ncbi:MAG: PD-(D/E)XK nuclease family protein [bacterium]
MLTNERNTVLAPHLSWSQISLFMRCAKAYYEKYIMCAPQRPTYSLLSGKSVHKGLELHNRELARNRPGMKVKDIVDASVAAFDAAPDLAELDVPAAKGRDQLVEDITDPVRSYLADVEPKDLDYAKPAAEGDVEKEVWFEVAGQKFVGYVDVVLPGLVVDYKLLGRLKSAQDVEKDGQLVLYSRALQRPAAFVQLVRGRARTTLTKQTISPAVSRGVMKSIEDAVRSIEIAKQTGHWPQCDAKNWMCGPTTCEYFRKCYAGTGGDYGTNG